MKDLVSLNKELVEKRINEGVSVIKIIEEASQSIFSQLEKIAKGSKKQDYDSKRGSFVIPKQNSRKTKELIKKLKEDLCFYGFIDPKTSLPEFRKIFSGDYPNNPVVWTGSLKELKFFILKIRLFISNADIWVITSACFIKNNRAHIDSRNLGKEKHNRVKEKSKKRLTEICKEIRSFFS